MVTTKAVNAGIIGPLVISAPPANTEALTISGGSLTGANVQSFASIAGTWNTSGTPSALKINITNTSSNGSSKLIDAGTGGGSYASKFSVRYDGQGTFVGGLVVTGDISLGSTTVVYWNGGDLQLRREGAAILRLGSVDVASPVAQTVGVQGSRSGTDTNAAGANFTLRSGIGTGTGAVTSLILQSPTAVGSGTGAQTSTTGLTIKNGTAILVGYTVAALPAGTQGAIAFVTDALTPTFLTTAVGGGAVVSPVFYNGAAWVTV